MVSGHEFVAARAPSFMLLDQGSEGPVLLSGERPFAVRVASGLPLPRSTMESISLGRLHNPSSSRETMAAEGFSTKKGERQRTKREH